MTSQQISEGTKVQGFYHDIPYIGVVTEARVDAAAHKYLFTVALDAPINCYSKMRDRIHFCADDFVTIGRSS